MIAQNAGFQRGEWEHPFAMNMGKGLGGEVRLLA